MDLRDYYRQIRETHDSLTGEFVVLISNKTADGGKAGVATEVSRAVAARVLVEGRARVATKEEAASYAQDKEESYARAQPAEPKVQVMVVAEEQLRQMRKRKEGK
ncbi:MAG: hypothetical protein HYZ37_10150 [Candidatus Solibacter usitatus]|nr:hypothetical protein [Candidatus Solibacter usitatus]